MAERYKVLAEIRIYKAINDTAGHSNKMGYAVHERKIFLRATPSNHLRVFFVFSL